MIILDYHLENFCMGIRTVFYHTQKMFYLLKGWKTIQKVIRSCVICKIRNCQMKNKTVAPIPELLPCRYPDISKQCFDISFYDIAGPFYISDNDMVRKMYYLLITCSRSRAVHIEMIGSRSTSNVLKSSQCNIV